MKPSQEQKAVLDYIASNPKIKADGIGEATSVKGKNLQKALKRLVDEGSITIEKEGKDFLYSAVSKEAEAAEAEGSNAANEEVENFNSMRDNTKYSFNGEKYPKSRLVLAVIKKHVEDNKKITLPKLQEAFKSSELQPRFGVVEEISKAKKFCIGRDRYFMKADEVLKVGDKKVVVCNQWSAANIKPFLVVAKSLRIVIK